MKATKEDYSDIPESFKRQMYDSYVSGMNFYGKRDEAKPYEEWLEEVINTKIPERKEI